MTGAVDPQSGAPALTFSHLELAQAAAFLLTVQQSEGGIIQDPLSMLQFRYAIAPVRAQALAAELELIGFWTLFIDHDGRQCALTLRR
ncbi:hypothetical protein FHW58_001882 [Duganella sp. 1224]|uniref:hypothetical protein n=1 Tax=Duganella sp. 1224 TaxID=2587052 RepID=UPI0015C98AF1|nr:hypothetical protein [Duganella sp. 1224]NYE60730.1 hypothetical protein [Duganella sp. 1224]